MSKARKEARSALESTALMIDAVGKLAGLVGDLNERQERIIETIGAMSGHIELMLVIEGTALHTLVELCAEADRTDLLVKLKDRLEMVNMAQDLAVKRKGGPDL